MFDDMLVGERGAARVHRLHRVPSLGSHVLNGRAHARAACIGKAAVHISESFKSSCKRFLNRCFFRHIAGECDSFAAAKCVELFHRAAILAFIARPDRDICARLDKPSRHRKAKPAIAASDDCAMSGKVEELCHASICGDFSRKCQMRCASRRWRPA